MERRYTILPPSVVSTENSVEQNKLLVHCLACQVNYALSDTLFCSVCKEESDKVRLKITHLIQRFELTFNVEFKPLFPPVDDETRDTIPEICHAVIDSDIIEDFYCEELIDQLSQVRKDIESATTEQRKDK